MGFFAKKSNKTEEMTKMEKAIRCQNPADGLGLEFVFETPSLFKPPIGVLKPCSKFRRAWNAVKAMVTRPTWFKKGASMIGGHVNEDGGDCLDTNVSVFISPSPSLENLSFSAFQFMDPPSTFPQDDADNAFMFEADFEGSLI